MLPPTEKKLVPKGLKRKVKPLPEWPGVMPATKREIKAPKTTKAGNSFDSKQLFGHDKFFPFSAETQNEQLVLMGKINNDS